MNPTQALRHFLLALQFFTRVPVTGRLADWVGYSPAMLRASAAHFPGVGWIVGAWSAAVAWGALALLPPVAASPFSALVAGALATAASVWLTGAFHEDGLADTADGLGGSADKARALEIMKDSRIGSYGTVALVLALGLKLALLAVLAQRGAPCVAVALLAGHVLSRLAPLLVMACLPHVGDHAGSKSKPLADAVTPRALAAAVLWCIPAVVGMLSCFDAIQMIACALLMAAALGYLTRLYRRRLGGFTGDTLGAAQQVSELALLLGLALAP